MTGTVTNLLPEVHYDHGFIFPNSNNSQESHFYKIARAIGLLSTLLPYVLVAFSFSRDRGIFLHPVSLSS
jgi:hypothetical protein